MYTAVSVSSVSGLPRSTVAGRIAGWFGSVFGAGNNGGAVNSTSTVNAASHPAQPKSLPAVQTASHRAPISIQQNLPMGLLLSVAQPSGSNSRADLDYQALRIALQSDNITAAQQAYVRLQSDLLLFHSTSNQPTPGNGAAGSGSQLNTTA